MATRARIGIRNDDGTVTSIYVHNRGELEGVGQTLLFQYSTGALAKRLTDSGDVSELAESVSDCVRFAGNNPAYKHSFEEWPKSGQYFDYLITDDYWWYRKAGDSDWFSLIEALKNKKTEAAVPKTSPNITPQKKWVTKGAVFGSEAEIRLQNEGWEPFAAVPFAEVPGGVIRVVVMYRREET